MAGAGADGATTIGGLPLTLVRPDKSEIPTSEALAGLDYIGLYFSASWCPPCRALTPVLDKWLETNGEKRKVKFILVSSEREEPAMWTYLAGHKLPYAVPFSKGESLFSKYAVKGIPTLVIIDKDGNLVTNKGSEYLRTKPDQFPWKPRTVFEILASATVQDKHGNAVDVAKLRENDAIGLYFSAHWCPPCRAFTPELVEWFNRQTAVGGPQHGKLDLLFVSSDKEEKLFDEYYEEMPWKALAFKERAAWAELKSLFDVSGIPSLIFIDKTGAIITANGRERVSTDPDGFPWPPKARASLVDAVDDINERPTLVMFTDNVTDDDNEAAAVKALDEVATLHFKDGKPSERIRFALGSASQSDACDSVRTFIGTSHQRDKDGPTAVRVTILDVPNRKKYLFADGALKVPTGDELTAFVKSFLEGTAKSQHIKG